jgi:hypothetical protein
VDQRLLVGEPAVHGADADPRAPGDVVQGDLQAALAELLGRRHQDPLAVALGVPAQRPRGWCFVVGTGGHAVRIPFAAIATPRSGASFSV